MKSIKTAAVAALLCTSFITTPAMATPIPVTSAPDLDDAQAQCELLYPITSTDTVEAAVASPAYEEGTPSDTGNYEDSDVTGGDPNSVISYSGGVQVGAVGRIGGSPNMFRAVAYDTKTYSASLVDRTFETVRTDLYNFTCDRFHDVVTTQVITNPGADNPGLGNCVGDPSDGSVNGQGPGRGAIHANPHSACSTGETIYIHTWTPSGSTPIQFGLDVIGSRGPVSTSIPQSFDEHNGPYDIYTAVVVCNSPTGNTKGNPGSWRAQNGYSGANCNTTYYSTAPQLSGRRVDSTNSVPAS